MDEGSVGLIGLLLTGFGVSIVFNLVIKKPWIAVLISAILVTCPPKTGPGVMLGLDHKEGDIWQGTDTRRNR